jgi:NAD(P)-dependent dehydrogenase (short-subunit alcohol dehydrogenase family)
MSEFKGKIVLVTGASKGLGRAVAKKFIESQARVIAVARSVPELESLDDFARTQNNRITIVPLNLTEHNKIDELGYNIHKMFGRLDILVSCAAMFGELSPLGHISVKQWQQIMDLNFHANWRLLRSMDPLLRISEAGRVIFTTSDVARTLPAYYGAYAVSKAALEALLKVYANETIKTNIVVSLVCPSAMETKLRRDEFPGIESNLGSDPEQQADIFLKLAGLKFKESGALFKIDNFHEFLV